MSISGRCWPGPDIDAVLIATPAHWHATMAVMAAEAGKDIYCEKPTAVTVRESRAVQEAVRRYGRIYQAGTQQRSEYGGIFRRACEFVRSGRLGRLKEIYAYRDGGAIAWPKRFGPGQAGPRRPGLGPLPGSGAWNCLTTATPAPTGSTSASSTGASTITISSSGPRTRTSTGPVELFMRPTASRATSTRAAWWSTAGLIPGNLSAARAGPVFVGSAGRIAVDRNALVSYPAGIAANRSARPKSTFIVAKVISANFLECVRSRKRPICDAGIAHRAASALLLGGVVKQLDRPLKWDPALEEFTGDDEANRFLSFAQRPPWRI